MSVEVRVAVAASPPEVWRRLADFRAWPEWNPTCVAATAGGPLTPGTRLRLELVHPRGRTFLTAPVLSQVVPDTRLAWDTRSFGFRAPTEITLEPTDGATLVRLTSTAHGPLAFTYRLTFPEKTQALLWSGALTGLARSFSG